MSSNITRRTLLAGALAPVTTRLAAQSVARRVERWGRFELELAGPREGNPFLDVRFSAEFRRQHRTVPVDGFYDGAGAYKVRFSPDDEGEWNYVTRSNRRELDGQTGSFVCTGPSAANHGPVTVRNTCDFGLRRRHALLSLRHHLLRLDPSARRTAAADHRNPPQCALQQDAHVHLPEVVRLQSRRAARLSVPAPPKARTTTPASSPSSSTTWKPASASCRRSALRPT